MNDIKDILKNYQDLSVKERVALARESESRIDKETLRRTKDIGGILVPSAFQIPNEIVDEGWLAELKGSELKVLIFIIRKTFGFNKISGDKIPLSQITKATGLSRQSAMTAISVLEKVGLIKVIRGKSSDGMRKINFYTLIVRDDYNKAPLKK